MEDINLPEAEDIENRYKEQAEEYHYNVGYTDKDDCFVAKAEEFGFLSAHGDTESEALTQVKFVVAASLQWLDEADQPRPEPRDSKNSGE